MKIVRLSLTSLVLGAGVLLGAPSAHAQEVCAYPFDCSPIGGGDGGAGTILPGPGAGAGNAGLTDATAGGVTGASVGGGRTVLPFTGGEAALLGLTGVGAVAGGALLVAAGRRRGARA